MKYFSILFISLLIASQSFSQGAAKTFHDYSGRTILGDSISFAQYAGKKLLVVNTASYCGYTPQYKQLEQLESLYGGAHFAVLGFPSDDFNQEPGTDSTINKFCDSIYGVTFQMMSKVRVIYPDTAEVYKWLQRKNLNGVSNAHVQWNFNKFLVDEQGHWVAYYSQLTLPTDTAIVNWITQIPISTGEPAVKSSPVLEFTGSNLVQKELSFNLNNLSSPKVIVKLFSINGAEVATLFDGNVSGQEAVNYNVSDLSSGLYLLQVQTPISLETRKVVIDR